MTTSVAVAVFVVVLGSREGEGGGGGGLLLTAIVFSLLFKLKERVVVVVVVVVTEGGDANEWMSSVSIANNQLVEEDGKARKPERDDIEMCTMGEYCD